jgi:hypothetical protein
MSKYLVRGFGVLLFVGCICAAPARAQETGTVDLHAVTGSGGPFIDLHACNGAGCALGSEPVWHVLVSFLGETAVSGCSVHGPHITSPVGPVGPDLFVGSPRVQCGAAHAMVVTVQNCRADISVHGYVHVDAPEDPFIGLTTIDVSVEKVPAANNVKLRLKLHNPKKPVELQGSFPGELNISTCPF